MQKLTCSANIRQNDDCCFVLHDESTAIASSPELFTTTQRKRKPSHCGSKKENLLWIELEESTANTDQTQSGIDTTCLLNKTTDCHPNARHVYSPGDLLRGNVNMACIRPLFANSVTIQFSCVEMVLIKNDETLEEQITEHVVYNDSVVISNKQMLYEPGNYSFPFEWRLPNSPTSSLPSPTGFGFFEILHLITATVKGGFFASLNCELPFVVESDTEAKTKRNYTKRKAGDVLFEVWTDKSSYYPNEFVEVSIECCSMQRLPTSKIFVGVFQNNSAKVVMSSPGIPPKSQSYQNLPQHSGLSKRLSSLNVKDDSLNNETVPSTANQNEYTATQNTVIRKFSAKKVLYQFELPELDRFYYGKRVLRFPLSKFSHPTVKGEIFHSSYRIELRFNAVNSDPSTNTVVEHYFTVAVHPSIYDTSATNKVQSNESAKDFAGNKHDHVQLPQQELQSTSEPIFEKVSSLPRCESENLLPQTPFFADQREDNCEDFNKAGNSSSKEQDTAIPTEYPFITTSTDEEKDEGSVKSLSSNLETQIPRKVNENEVTTANQISSDAEKDKTAKRINIALPGQQPVNFPSSFFEPQISEVIQPFQREVRPEIKAAHKTLPGTFERHLQNITKPVTSGEKSSHSCTGVEFFYRQPWTADSSDECQICHKNFGLLSLRHHCRVCGREVCSSCSPERVAIARLEYHTPVRVCVDCKDRLFADAEPTPTPLRIIPISRRGKASITTTKLKDPENNKKTGAAEEGIIVNHHPMALL